MKKFYLISENEKQHKADLHSHTTCSDGKHTPLKSKELYKKRGYSVVAFSDHDVFVPHHDELTDDSFVALNAFELCVPSFSESEFERAKQVHLNFIATRSDIKNMPFYNPKYIYQKGAKEFIGKIAYVGELEDRRHDVEWLNYCIKKGNDEGFLVTYNHPVWSLSQPQDYLPLEGLFGMEVWNTSGLYNAPEDGAAWREMIFSGKDVKCVAANDFHSNTKFDCMTAATYICTNDFSYEGVISALQQGKFYSSTGPTIQEISISDEKIHIRCSPVKVIRIFSAQCVCAHKVANFGEFLTEVDIPLQPCHKNMFYVHLTDKHGNQAWSNPYFNLGKHLLDAQLQDNRPSRLFLHDKMESYSWLDSLNNKLAHTYFAKQLIVDQIEEIIDYCEQYKYKRVFIQFSSSEIVGYDYIFDLGENAIKKMQEDRLRDIALQLDEFAEYAVNNGMKITFLSMLPLPHSAMDIYDYRNNYARSINELAKKTAEQYGFEYKDVSSSMMNKNGILDEKYSLDPTASTEKYFKRKFKEK